MSKKLFGQTENRDIFEFTIESGELKVTLLEYGATIHNIFYKGTDCVLGYDDLEGYINGESHQGGTVGRFANRIANASFSLNGQTYNLGVNNGVNSLHGGFCGFSHRCYNGEQISDNSVCFTIFSPDEEGGYPGNLTFKVTFTVEDNTLKIEYFAESDKDTVVNFTNHAYFNLGAESCLKTKLRIDADYYTPTNENMIPTGVLESVENTPFDFRTAKEIGADIFNSNEQIIRSKGYDHNFVLSTDIFYKKDVIEAYCEETGIGLTCSTDMPGVQLYAATWLDEPKGKNGKPLTQYAAFCLETQFFPNTPNELYFPSCVLKANDTFKSVTEYKFFEGK